MTAEGAWRDCIEEAAILIERQRGAPEAICREHVARADGFCAACCPSVSWPCVMVVIARAAEGIRIARNPGLRRAGAD